MLLSLAVVCFLFVSGKAEELQCSCPCACTTMNAVEELNKTTANTVETPTTTSTKNPITTEEQKVEESSLSHVYNDFFKDANPMVWHKVMSKQAMEELLNPGSVWSEEAPYLKLYAERNLSTSGPKTGKSHYVAKTLTRFLSKYREIKKIRPGSPYGCNEILEELGDGRVNVKVLCFLRKKY